MMRPSSGSVVHAVLLLVVIDVVAAFQQPGMVPSRSPRHATAVQSGSRCACTPILMVSQEKQEERAETVEYFKTLGGFSAASIGLFVALTAGAGMEDVAAGNIVLVALCAYGVYLLFFDGGVTQAALENQAIRQLAQEEGDIMSTAPRADVGAFSAEAVMASASPAVEALETDGYVRIDEALSPQTASALLAYVNEELEQKRAALTDDMDLASQSAFGDVLMRENRYDLMLDLEPPVC